MSESDSSEEQFCSDVAVIASIYAMMQALLRTPEGVRLDKRVSLESPDFIALLRRAEGATKRLYERTGHVQTAEIQALAQMEIYTLLEKSPYLAKAFQAMVNDAVTQLASREEQQQKVEQQGPNA